MRQGLDLANCQLAVNPDVKEKRPGWFIGTHRAVSCCDFSVTDYRLRIAQCPPRRSEKFKLRCHLGQVAKHAAESIGVVVKQAFARC